MIAVKISPNLAPVLEVAKQLPSHNAIEIVNVNAVSHIAGRTWLSRMAIRTYVRQSTTSAAMWKAMSWL